MLFRNRTHRSLWLALLVASAAGGWYCGRSQRIFHTAAAGAASTSPDTGVTRDASRPPFPAGSPRASWMERVKNARNTDFPKLNQEWNEVFPEDDRYEEYHAPNALAAYRWMIGVWLVKDQDGFIKAVSDAEFWNSYYAAEVMVELVPEKAAEWIFRRDFWEGKDEFAARLGHVFAAKHPVWYLKINPDGGDMTVSADLCSAWRTAIGSLAGTDAMAAGKACLRWNFKNSNSVIHHAMLDVAEAWRSGDPPISQWVDGIEDPRMRNLAKHAWLSTLAVIDPQAALTLLDSAGLADDCYLIRDARAEILEHLSRKDPVTSLRRMKELEDYFEVHHQDWLERNHDPFADSLFGAESAGSQGSLDPDASGQVDEENGVRSRMLTAIAQSLPSDPDRFFAKTAGLIEAIGGDDSFKRGVESFLIRSKCGLWSGSDCLDAAAKWSARDGGPPDGGTLTRLLSRAAVEDPEAALAGAIRFSGRARSILIAEAVKFIPSGDIGRHEDLLRELPAAQWDAALGAALGRGGGDNSTLVDSLPEEVSQDVFQAFARNWVEQDPDACVAWVESLKDYPRARAAAEGLVAGWSEYDIDAAGAWVKTLAGGVSRDVAVSMVGLWYAKHGDEREGWAWVDRICNPAVRAQSFDQLAEIWAEDAPVEFRAAHDHARKDAGLSERGNRQEGQSEP